MISLYKVEFKKYTNGMCDTVWSEELKQNIKTEKGYVTIKENDIEYIMKFGNGISNMEYVGELYEEDNKEKQFNFTININSECDVDKLVKKINDKLTQYI